jgi:hypothetical protein
MRKKVNKGSDIVANEQNLVPNYERTPSERQEIARKGGIASGEARREKATMKKVLESMLDEVAKVENNKDNLTYKQLATLGLIKGAVDGNATNYKTIVEMIGELKQENETKEPIINVTINTNEDLKEKFFEMEENDD